MTSKTRYEKMIAFARSNNLNDDNAMVMGYCSHLKHVKFKELCKKMKLDVFTDDDTDITRHSYKVIYVFGKKNKLNKFIEEFHLEYATDPVFLSALKIIGIYIDKIKL